jgi:ubiquitin-conjugating enzyme E2 A
MSRNHNISTKRLSYELASFKNDPIDCIDIIPPIDLMLWYAKITGPSNTPYENNFFDLSLKFSTDYPITPPSVQFLTPMFHPNIYRDGKICIDILQTQEWSPAQNVRTILLSIISLLTDPNTKSPANRDASILYEKNQDEYNNHVKQFIIANKNKHIGK